MRSRRAREGAAGDPMLKKKGKKTEDVVTAENKSEGCCHFSIPCPLRVRHASPPRNTLIIGSHDCVTEPSWACPWGAAEMPACAVLPLGIHRATLDFRANRKRFCKTPPPCSCDVNVNHGAILDAVSSTDSNLVPPNRDATPRHREIHPQTRCRANGHRSIGFPQATMTPTLQLS